jgi:hypothetical protein
MLEFTSMFNEYGVPNMYGKDISMQMMYAIRKVLSNVEDIHPLNIIEIEHILHSEVSVACADARIKAQRKMMIAE